MWKRKHAARRWAVAEEVHHPDGRIEHPSVRHEHSDASFGWVLGLIIGAAILGVIIFFAVLEFLDHTAEAMAVRRGSRFPLAGGPSNMLPPEPRLEQLNRLAGIAASNAEAREAGKLAVLNSLGASSEAGFVHIPIERAMQLLADKLPARAANRDGAATTAVTAIGLVSGSAARLSATCNLYPGSVHMVEAYLRRRESGLVNGGVSNSGRLFKGMTRLGGTP